MKKVLLIYGGESYEHDISIKSYNTINKDKKISYTTSADYTTIAKNIKIEELENNENVTYLLETYPAITKLELHRLDNISDEERSNKETYSSTEVNLYRKYGPSSPLSSRP